MSDGSAEPAGGGYTLAVAVANPAHVEQLMRTAIDVAAANGGSVHVVTVAHKPPTSPFAVFSDDVIVQEYAGGRREVLERAVDAAEGTTVSADGDVLVGTNVADAILTAVDDLDADALLLGWRGTPSPEDVVLGTTIDPVLRRAPCDVLVEKVGTQADGVESILLPVAGGRHADLAVEVAGAIASANDAALEVLSVLGHGTTTDDRETARKHVDSAASPLEGIVTVERTIREDDDVVAGIVAAATDHDLVVLGATRRGLLRRRLVGSIPRIVGSHVDLPVIMTRRPRRRVLSVRALGRWLR